jgi:hypothetical protein
MNIHLSNKLRAGWPHEFKAAMNFFRKELMAALNSWGISLALFTGVAQAATVAPSWEHPPHQQREGIFWREHWYERGITNHNPAYERRLRVNPPEVVLHPQFGPRVEARENGLMLIPAEENLFQIAGAELYLEMWGGHPGTAGKRVSVNGRNTYWFPRLGAEDGHCTYSYPVLPLERGDLVNGWNAFQLALDQGTTFWGHMMVDEACLRVALTNRHPDIVQLGLAEFTARVKAEPRSDAMTLALEAPAGLVARIARVDFQAWYSAYDENGNRRDTDWHGFTRNRKPGAFAGTATTAPFETTWDIAMLPAQKNVAVRALVRFQDAPELVYVTAATTALSIPDRADANVALYYAHDLPLSFWSRAKNKKTCSVMLDVEPAKIERAELFVVTWTGGPGEVKDYFTLNGKQFPVAEGSKHIPVFSRLPVEPSLLKQGANTIELLSDTEHHGIEVLLPGPALVVRRRQ